MKGLPLMKGIERMMREKVSGDVARVSACEGIGRGGGVCAHVAKMRANPNVRKGFFHWQFSSSKVN